MINDPKDIAEILKALDKITFEQLDRAIKNADKEYEEMKYDTYENINHMINEISTGEIKSYIAIESQQLELNETFSFENMTKDFINEEGENIVWKEEKVLVA